MTKRDSQTGTSSKGSLTDEGREERVNKKILHAAEDVLIHNEDEAATSSNIYESLESELKCLIEKLRITEQGSSKLAEKSKSVAHLQTSSTKGFSKRTAPAATAPESGKQQNYIGQTRGPSSEPDKPESEKGTKVEHDICLQPLSSEERGTVNSLTYNVPLEKRIIHIKEAKIHLTASDLWTLRGHSWLNDEIINSFAALINTRSLLYRNFKANDTDTQVLDARQSQPTKEVDIFQLARPRVHAFNSFFWVSLTRSQSGFNYSGVRRWLKRAFPTEPFTRYDFFLFPINKNNSHWVLSAIDLRGKQFLYFDSFHAPDDFDVLGNLRRWLKEAVGDILGPAAVAEMDIDAWTCVINPSYTPKQKDGSACGIFILYLAYYLELGKRPAFLQKDVHTLRNRTALFLKQGKLPET